MDLPIPNLRKLGLFSKKRTENVKIKTKHVENTDNAQAKNTKNITNNSRTLVTNYQITFQENYLLSNRSFHKMADSSAEIISGKEIAAEIRAELKEKI